MVHIHVCTEEGKDQMRPSCYCLKKNFIWFKFISTTSSETKERNNLDTLYMYVR